MSSLLLSTKNHVPPLRAGGVVRSRLIQRISEGLRLPGTHVLISAPAGFGKTTLLSEFVASFQQPFGWFSLDEGDNDPVYFWSYFIKAVQSVFPKWGEDSYALCQSPQPLPPGAIPISLVNEFSMMNGEFTLILDDFHVIENSSLQSELLTLVEHLPGSVHLIIATRTDPPWPVAKMRARNQLLEIRAKDLRFSPEEADQFVEQVAGIRLSDQAVATLEEKTEGWAAGLQLAAISMKGRTDADRFIESLSGIHVYIAEYLIEEVLNLQPESVQTFLIQTSILKALTPSLCDAVCMITNAQEILTRLNKSNLFIVTLDDTGEWFRYHHLFADLLQARLIKKYYKKEVAEFHERASRWFSEAGMFHEAIEHAIRAENYPLVEKLIGTSALPMILQANVRTVEKWLQSLPRSFVDQSIPMLMAYSWLFLLRGTPQLASPYIAQLKILFSCLQEPTTDAALFGEWFALQAELLVNEGRFDEAQKLADQALGVYPLESSPVRSMTYVSLAKAYQRTYQYEEAANAFKRIVEAAEQMGDPVFEILGISGQAQMYLKNGKLRKCYEIAMEGIRRVEWAGRKTPFAATLYGEVGEVYYQGLDFEQASAFFQRSAQMSGKNGYSDPEIYDHLMRSKMDWLKMDRAGALAEMDAVTRLVREIPPVMIRENVIAAQVWLHLKNDETEAARGLLETEGFSFGETLMFPDLLTLLPDSYAANLLYNSGLRFLLHRAKTSLSESDFRRTYDLCTRILASEQNFQQIPLAIETLLIRSQLCWLKQQNGLAFDDMRAVLEICEPEGYLSVFLEEDTLVADILRSMLREDQGAKKFSDTIHKLLSVFPRNLETQQVEGTGSAHARRGEDDLIEPLTRREREVLEQIVEGSSNQEIADRLVITLSAVKKHTGNIFRKLNVKNRTTAVAAARKAGLVRTGD